MGNQSAECGKWEILTAIAAGASGALVVFRKYTVCAVLKMLFANQYRVSPAGTFSEKKPIIRGRYFKIA